MRTSARSATTALLLALVTGTLAGCGTAPSATDPVRTAGTAVTGPAGAATPTVSNASPAPVTPPPGGNGDSAAKNQPGSAGGGICAHLSAASVGEVLGGGVTSAALPGGGCGFDQANRLAPAATFVETRFDAARGGMAAAKTDATSSVEGRPQDLTGIGTAAFVVTGSAFGGTAVQGAGAVRLGTRLINVTLDQDSGLDQAAVRALVIALLDLAVSRA